MRWPLLHYPVRPQWQSCQLVRRLFLEVRFVKLLRPATWPRQKTRATRWTRSREYRPRKRLVQHPRVMAYLLTGTPCHPDWLVHFLLWVLASTVLWLLALVRWNWFRELQQGCPLPQRLHGRGHVCGEAAALEGRAALSLLRPRGC